MRTEPSADLAAAPADTADLAAPAAPWRDKRPAAWVGATEAMWAHKSLKEVPPLLHACLAISNV